MRFNEDTRVKIPTILHLTRLGYGYLSLKEAQCDENTNIFPALFREGISRINSDLDPDEIGRLREDVSLLLDNEDLGKAFYEQLTRRSGTRLIDFENFDNNSFHVVTELPCKNGDDEFRPDITLLINGMPLVFIEVKKPNNRDGVLAERSRINARFQNKKFRRFINITQLMLFSNNMEYDNESPEPIEGAFYASTSYQRAMFNYFREEEPLNIAALLKPENETTETAVLKDNNSLIIQNSPEFMTNKDPDTPTNRLCTSLLSRERLRFILRYAIAYVKEKDGWEQHVMRYPQLFATKAIENKLAAGVRKGIIWHTQGSGKTALAYYSVRYLVDYFQKQKVIPKFYFIVDRLDLLKQASREFINRGLTVHAINSREAFAQDIKQTTAIHNDTGKLEITVVNIQKFQDDPNVMSIKDYDVSIQRIYFLDEVHRSYNPQGSFLANLEQSDKNAIKIGLTGTPLLGKDYNSKILFGDYIHKYYYNKSIADGYTLRLIREAIENNYQIVLQEVLAKLEVEKGKLSMKEVVAHHTFVKPMLAYIVRDFEKSRTTLNDNSIGGMVICDSSAQAKEMFAQFQANYAFKPVAEMPGGYGAGVPLANKAKIAALILHDVGSKEERDDWVEDFKAGNIDLLFVYNMLLTGFDAKRLKKLYLGRVIKDHNLLQALTRVNRTYGKHRYGYVVDFADIRSEFDKTNKAYFDELQNELGDEMEHYSKLFKSAEEIKEEFEAVKNVLFQYDTLNKEIFSRQVTEMQDRAQVLALKKALADARSLYNLCRLFGYDDLLQRLPFAQINALYNEVDNHLAMLNLKDRLENQADTSGLLNMALEEVLFKFVKIGEEELKLADELKDALRRARESMTSNVDPKDPEFIQLKEELERLFKNRNLKEVTQDEMKHNMLTLNKIQDKVREINRKNRLLQSKYSGDIKFTRVHKRLVENGSISDNERRIFEALHQVKQQADESVMQNRNILDNESYFERMIQRSVVQQFHLAQNIKLTPDSTRYINQLVVKEYLDEFNGVTPW
ncbi:type I restriction endonuclease subunit R [Thiothrix lacustris]|uniref:type I restriction endonuclease subunit R n=1 Tax=Thiothrix lacustris TaxID=525917 RepID=UPI0004910BC3|nr:type I restriction endonuclease [Thiothrix lacustris]